MSSAEMCKQLYTEAVDRGIRINGKLCNAVMVGFGSDLTVSRQLYTTRTYRNACTQRVRLPVLPGCRSLLGNNSDEWALRSHGHEWPSMLMRVVHTPACHVVQLPLVLSQVSVR